jgi:phosphoribosylformylglycinamidine synthase
MLLALLNHPNIRSKEDVIRRFDHEIRGATVVKPLVGIKHDGPSDAAVMKPTNTKGFKGFAIANGINPFIGEINPYNMAISAVDEAVRNITAVGGDPAQTAILDNFCWGDPRNPDTLGSLVEASRGCHDAAVLFGTPFISGKDSLNNEYYGNDGKRHAIPGTLLISSISITEDVRKSITMDLKNAGDNIYLVGEWQPALAGSHAMMIDNNFFGNINELDATPCLSKLAPQVYRRLHQAIQDGLVNAAHDLSEGGLALSAAEMSLAGRLGLNLDISKLHSDQKLALFAETNGCILVSVSEENKNKIESMFAELPIQYLGNVTTDYEFKISHNQKSIMNIKGHNLTSAFLNQEKAND